MGRSDVVAAASISFLAFSLWSSVYAAEPLPDLNQRGLTGSWYQPATSGQGIEVEFFPDLVAPDTALVQGAWFTFDIGPSGGADHNRWYTFSGNAQNGMPNVPITIYQNIGGNFNAPPITEGEVVGSGTLAFNTCNSGTLNYAFSDGSGRTGTIPLTRLLANVTCTAGTAPKSNTDFGFSGNWYDTATSGQGFVFEVNPATPYFFLAWYTYAPTGQEQGASGQRWFTGGTSYTPESRTVTLPLYETTGGLFDHVSTPAPATVQVGTATVTLASCSSAQVQFTFTGGSAAGKTGTISLGRVGPVPAECPKLPIGGQGAALPYWEFEAENANTNGTILGPSRDITNLASEASARMAVRLDQVGQYVEFASVRPANSIVVRYSIPDAPSGGGIDATLGLYINGVRARSLALTSRYSWVYGGYTNSRSKNPLDGGAHHFFDEVHALVNDIPVGSTVRLQKDFQDTASFYVIDLIDFEQVPPPLGRPPGSISITEFGAIADDGLDDRAAMQLAINAARVQRKTLWIPPGQFDVLSSGQTTGLTTSDVTIQGAGMWYQCSKVRRHVSICLETITIFVTLGCLGRSPIGTTPSDSTAFGGPPAPTPALRMYG